MAGLDTADTVLRLGVATLATWRVAHLLAFEDGPAGLVARLRAAAGRWGGLLDCFYCLSLWVAGACATWAARDAIEWLLFAFAISGAACVLHRVSGPSLDIQPLADGDHDHGMLRTDESLGRGAGGAGG